MPDVVGARSRIACSRMPSASANIRDRFKWTEIMALDRRRYGVAADLPAMA